MKRVSLSVGVAATLWFVMFSPWTAPHVPFWWAMTGSALCLTALSLCLGGNPFQAASDACPTQAGHTPTPHTAARPTLMGIGRTALMGFAIAVVLWGVFWLGDKVSQLMFSFARPQVDSIYGMQGSTPSWLVALLLLFVIGPAEEVFWRGFVQRKMVERWGTWAGFAVATACYTSVHIFSGNLMLLLAAAACGTCWGLLYRLFPRQLPALILSHALWDAAAFVIFPF